MSEDRNEQFAEPLVGREGVEAEFGYKRMPEDKPSAQAEIDIKTAVEELRASRPAEEPIEAIEYKRLENGEKAPENETVSLERAADDLTAYHSQQSVERAKSISEDFAKAIDSMRADALKANPKANDELGLSKQEIAAAKAAKTEAAQDETVPETLEARQEPSEPDAYDSIEGLEPGSHVTAGDVKLPTGVELAADPELVLAIVSAAPTADQLEPEAAAEAPAEAEVPAEEPAEA